MRLQIESPVSRQQIESEIKAVTAEFEMTYELDVVGRKMRTLILVSKAAHCLNDLLFRQRSAQLPILISKIVSNHKDLSSTADFYGVDFQSLEIASPEAKKQFENNLRDIITKEKVELIVLARFMQILSPEFCKEFEGRIINIHHSFLPGFKGADPYAQAHSRGVKLIGATAHFVTIDLDEGPIIEQNVVRVEHGDSRNHLLSIGQDVESRTLSKAVRWFAERRVLLDGARTIIFS